MRSRNTALLSIALLPALLHAQQNEIEPNEATTQATPWTYGQTMSGQECQPTLGTDYFRIVLPTDGVINFSVTSQGTGIGPGDLQFALFPKMGFYQQYHTLPGASTPTNATFSHSCLSGDTMYVRVQWQTIFQPNSCVAYTMSFTVTPALYVNDVGNNADISTAQPVALNTPINGHLDFLYDNSADWYVVTTPTDGKLRIILSSEHVEANTDGFVQISVSESSSSFNATLGASGVAEADTFQVTCLAAQPIHVRLQNGNSGVSCGISYQLRFEHVPNVFANDPLPNDDVSNPQQVDLDTPFEGHTSNIGDQTSDFFGFTLPDDGTLRIIVEAEHQGTTVGGLEIYEPHSNTSPMATVGALGIVEVDTIFISCARAGDDFIRVQNSNSGVACGISYRITLSLIPPAFGNDPEPNEDIADAVVVAPDTDQDGHLTYIGTSSYDHFKLWKGFAGTMRVVFSSSTAGLSPALNISTFNTGLNTTITTGENGAIAYDTVYIYTADPDTIQLRVSATSFSYCGSYRFRYEGAPVGMDENATAVSVLSAIPNPSASGSFRIRSALSRITRIEVLDTNGRVVHSGTVNAASDVPLDLTALSPGMYIANVRQSDGVASNLRLVISR